MIKQKTKMELFIYLRAWNVDDGLGLAYKSMYSVCHVDREVLKNRILFSSVTPSFTKVSTAAVSLNFTLGNIVSWSHFNSVIEIQVPKGTYFVAILCHIEHSLFLHLLQW